MVFGMGQMRMVKVGTECMESVEECIAPGWEQGIFWNVLEVFVKFGDL